MDLGRPLARHRVLRPQEAADRDPPAADSAHERAETTLAENLRLRDDVRGSPPLRSARRR